MAYVVPFLSAIGGGSAAAGGVVLATAAVGVYSAIEAKKAGDEASSEAKGAAIREGDAARGREIDRRRNLVRALASQNASAGAGGATGQSYEAIARSDIRDAQNDLLTDNVNSDARQRALRQRAGNFQRQGYAHAATSLLDTGSTSYNLAGGH